MGVKKRYLVICLMLLLMVIGGVAASEDASDDAVKTSGDNATLTVENKIVEEDNLALDGGSDSEEIESDDSNDENVLSASNENDVLGNTVYDTGVSPTITALNSFVTGNTVVDACFRHLDIARKKGIQEESLARLNIEEMDNILKGNYWEII